MIEWLGITFVCVAANHLGLVSAVEKVIGFPLPIVNCSKCLTFWVMIGHTFGRGLTEMLAVSFLCAWLAIWLELCMGIIDRLYIVIYEKIYGIEGDETAADAQCGDSADTVS